jgi:hypothetical protein
MMNKKVLETCIEAINGNKLKINSASCWSYYTDILRCTINKTLSLLIASINPTEGREDKKYV